MDVQGIIRDGAIVLEKPMAGLEGKRVRVRLDVVEEPERLLSAAEQRQAWSEWMNRGPQGPIEDEDGAWPQ